MRGGGALVRAGGSGGIRSDADEPDDVGSGGIFSDADDPLDGCGGIRNEADELPAGTGGGIFNDADEPDDGSGGIVVPRDGGAVIERIGGAGGTFVCVPFAERLRGNGATSPCATGSGAVMRADTLGGLNIRSSPGSPDSGF